MMIKVNTVDAANPAMMTIPTGAQFAAFPSGVPSHPGKSKGATMGVNPSNVVRAVIKMGRSRCLPPVMTASVRLHPLPAEVIDVIDQDDGIVDDHPYQNDETQVTGVVQRLIGELQNYPHSDEREGDGEHDRERLNEILEERRHDQVNQQHRKEQRKSSLSEILLSVPRPPSEAPFVTRR